MKIALVTPYDYPYPGGVTEHVRHLDREFRAHGHDTRIIASSTESRSALAPNVIAVTGDVKPIPFNGSTARITLSPDVSLRVQEILNAERFDIVHLHEPAAPLLCLSALYHSTAVNVGTFHAYNEQHAWYEYARPFLEWVYARLDGHILVSPAVRDALMPYVSTPSDARQGSPFVNSAQSGEYRIIPNGIDYARFAAPGIAPVPEFDDGRPNILFVGRLDERKGFPHLLRAFPAVQRAIPDARLVVVGAFDEQDKAHWNEYARAHDLRDVHFIGRVSPQELPRYYRTATLFCAPSTGGESFGIVLLEAMAAGLPVVASSIPGYRSVMQDGAQGRLVPPGDEKALADSIRALLQDRALRTRMAAQGRANAARYDWHLVAPRVLDYYEELHQARARRRQPQKASISSGVITDEKIYGVNVALGGLMHVLLPLLAGASTGPAQHGGTASVRLTIRVQAAVKI